MNNPCPTDNWLDWLYHGHVIPTEPYRFDILFDADFATVMHTVASLLARDVMTLEAMQRHYILEEQRRLAWANR